MNQISRREKTLVLDYREERRRVSYEPQCGREGITVWLAWSLRVQIHWHLCCPLSLSIGLEEVQVLCVWGE